MSRRRPKSFTHWVIGVLGTLITALVIYQLRIHRASTDSNAIYPALSNSFNTTSHHDYQRLASFLPTKSQPTRRLFAAKLR